MGFKDIVKADVHNVFLNLEEFADTHTVNGTDMAVLIDNNEQIEREKRNNQNMDGIFTNQRLIYVAASDFGPLPKQGSILTLDKRTFRVVDAINEDGVYSITLEANRA